MQATNLKTRQHNWLVLSREGGNEGPTYMYIPFKGSYRALISKFPTKNHGDKPIPSSKLLVRPLFQQGRGVGGAAPPQLSPFPSPKKNTGTLRYVSCFCWELFTLGGRFAFALRLWPLE